MIDADGVMCSCRSHTICTSRTPLQITVSQLHNGEYTTRVGEIGTNTSPFQVGRYSGSSGNLMIKVCSIYPWNGIEIARVSIGVNNVNCN